MSAQIMKRTHSSAERGEILLAVTRSARRTGIIWLMAICSLMAGCSYTVLAFGADWPNGFGTALAAVTFFVNGAIWLWSLWKSKDLPIVTFTEEGVVLANPLGDEVSFVPWSRLRRWTWNKIPQLQLNLFDGNYVFNFPIPAALREPVEEILCRKITAPQEPAAASQGEEPTATGGNACRADAGSHLLRGAPAGDQDQTEGDAIRAGRPR